MGNGTYNKGFSQAVEGGLRGVVVMQVRFFFFLS